MHRDGSPSELDDAREDAEDRQQRQWEKFKRALDRALIANSEWNYWRRTATESDKERLAEVASAAERTVLELYEAALRGDL